MLYIYIYIYFFLYLECSINQVFAKFHCVKLEFQFTSKIFIDLLYIHQSPDTEIQSKALQKVLLNTFSGSPGRAKAVSDKKLNSCRFVPQYFCYIYT